MSASNLTNAPGLDMDVNSLTLTGLLDIKDNSTMVYSMFIDNDNNYQIFGQNSNPTPAINPITILPSGEVIIPALSVPGGDVLSLITADGSGITATGTTNIVLSSGLVAGTNITLTPSVIVGNKTLTISATGNAGTVTSVTAGPGITVAGTASDPVITNAGVYSLTAGTNITLTGTAINPIISATGNAGTVTSVTAGTGISVTGTAPDPVINNTGVLSLTAGTNITLTGTATNPIISASGATGVNSVTSDTGSGILIGGTSADPKIYTDITGSNHIIITPSLIDTSINISNDLKVATINVLYTPTQNGSGILNSGYQYISGQTPPKQFFTLTAGLWLITFSGTISWNVFCTTPTIDLTLQDSTTNDVICASSFGGHSANYVTYFTNTMSVYTAGGNVCGLFVNWAAGSPFCQGVGNWTVKCQYVGSTQDPISSGTPYS
jgi:hypothetical protein